MSKQDLVQIFNNHLDEFFNDIITIFPDDSDLQFAKSGIEKLRALNTSLIIKIWYKYIFEPYKNEIEVGNIDFFLKKNYADDLDNMKHAAYILSKIATLREPISQFGDDNLQKTILYIQNLSKLSNLYNESRQTINSYA